MNDVSDSTENESPDDEGEMVFFYEITYFAGAQPFVKVGVSEDPIDQVQQRWQSALGTNKSKVVSFPVDASRTLEVVGPDGELVVPPAILIQAGMIVSIEEADEDTFFAFLASREGRLRPAAEPERPKLPPGFVKKQ